MKLFFGIIVFLCIAVPVAYATHSSTQCSVSISGEHFPVMYNESERNNPDGTFYPGDAFYYLFKYKGSETCGSFGIRPLYTENLGTINHYKIYESGNWDSKTSHSHDDGNHKVLYLRTDHYHERIKVHSDCAVQRGGKTTCYSTYETSDTPSFSAREDVGLSQRNYEKFKKGNYEIRSTYSWHIVRVGLEHGHSDTVTYQDDSSAENFERYVNSQCSNLKKHQGCMFGVAEIPQEKLEPLCIYDDLKKRGIDVTEQYGELGPYVMPQDSCITQQYDMNLTVKGTKISCSGTGSGEKCRTITVTRNKSLTPTVLDSDYIVNTEFTPIRDTFYFETKNLDDTFYHEDKIGITHIPSFKWKDERHHTIQFETERTHELIDVYGFDCTEDACVHTVSEQSLYPTNHTLGNGDGITILDSTTDYPFDDYLVQYHSTAYNIEREIGTGPGEHSAELVPYTPQYSDNYPYTLLKDAGEFSFDNRQGVVLHYLGSTQDDEIHPQRKSFINGFYNVGFGYDPYNPGLISQNYTFSDGIAHVDSLESSDSNAMFVKEGYGKLYFEYPLGEIVGVRDIPRFENVTSFTTLSSKDFAGKDTILDHYSMRYPEIPFTKQLNIKSVNGNGTTVPQEITLEVFPYQEITTEYISQYIHDKVLFDSGDDTIAEIISDDTYPMYQEYTSSSGTLSANITRTPIYFDEYETQTGNGTDFAGGLEDLPGLLDSPDTMRLSMPYDIGLGSLSPTTLKITADGVTNELDERYYSFGGKQTITINTEKDNILPVVRGVGKIVVSNPQYFGEIESLFIDGEPVKQDCKNGCILLFQPEKELHVTAENIWGGEASIVLKKMIVNTSPLPSEPDYRIPLAIVIILVLGWIVYKKFKNS